MPILGVIASSKSGRLSNPSYESIETITLGSNQTSITFGSGGTIPQTYKHLEIRIVSAGSDNTNVRLRFNGDTSTNYRSHGTNAGPGYGPGVYSYNTSAETSIFLYDQQVGNSTFYNAAVVNVLEYSSTTKNKVVKTLNGVEQSTQGFVYLTSGLWFKAPEAITSITLYPFSNFFYANSRFALYGIKG